MAKLHLQDKQKELEDYKGEPLKVSQFIKAVRVGRDYSIEIDFNVSFDELQNYCSANSKRNVVHQVTELAHTA